MTDAERAELARLQRIAADELLTPFESAACTAWNAIRGLDPEFHLLPMEMRHKLTDLAEKYIAGRAEAEGDYAPAGFFAAVRKSAPAGLAELPSGVIENRRVGEAERRDAFSARSVDVQRREGVADRRETPNVFFSDDTSSHAPNENAVIADPNGPPVPESDVSTDAGLLEFREFDGENRRVADLPFDHPERRA